MTLPRAYPERASGSGGGGTVTAESIGLGNVDNTSDVNKPISTAQQDALDLKVDTDPTAATGASAVNNIIIMSQANYDAISLKDPFTLYIIND